MNFFKLFSMAAMVASLVAVDSFAVTNQFRGVNWADKRDNFVSDALVLSGMAGVNSYDGAVTVAERVIGSFVDQLGTNSVRLPVNEPTVTTSYWNTYKAVIDVGLKYGRVVMGYWGPAQPAGPKDMNNWWAMWEKVVKEYVDDPNAYFEIFNEPHMYSKTELRDLYAKWLEKFPDVPRDHILLDGSGLAWNVPDIADDSRFDGCLFAVHEYSFWNTSIETEQGWMNSFKGKVGKYADRTVATEWGGAMGPGEKNGIHYDYMDYNKTPTNYFMAYIRGMTEQLRQWQMGSFYWVGLRDGDWYSMMKRSGEGANIKLEIVNQSGVDRMHYAWTDTVVTTPAIQEPFGGFDSDGSVKSGDIPSLVGKIEIENYDLGGNRVSYYDKDSENKGNVYRKDGVDVVGLDCSDSLSTKDCKGYAIGYTQEGEWMEYSVNVPKTKKYYATARVASGLDVAGFVLYVDDKAVTDSVKIPKGEDWVTYSNIDFETTEIPEGDHVLKLMFTGAYGNIDWLSFCEEEGCSAEDADAITHGINAVLVNAHEAYNVFTATGKYLGRVNANENLQQGLKTAGFAKGVYIMRSVKGSMAIRVQLR